MFDTQTKVGKVKDKIKRKSGSNSDKISTVKLWALSLQEVVPFR